MDPENVINLFDSCWFSYEILKKPPSYNYPDNYKRSDSSSELKFSSLRSILVRSKSDDMGSFNYGISFSPNSVLKSIPSAKSDFKITQKQEQRQQDQDHQEAETAKTDLKKQSVLQERNKNQKTRDGSSKSLSDLEFEELKGFMDLGFVFSEEDVADSSLVEIIPGLQRLGKERERESDSSSSITSSRRPYLSEAWEDLGRKSRKKEHKSTELMMNWEIPAVRDELYVKDNLKLWAHTVARFVR